MNELSATRSGLDAAPPATAEDAPRPPAGWRGWRISYRLWRERRAAFIWPIY